MLFKALLRRLNGGTDTASSKVSSSHRRSSHLAYQMFPNLQGLIMRLLSEKKQSQLDTLGVSTNEQIDRSTMKAQSVFAALEIIERSGLPPAYEVGLRKTLWEYAESPDWAIREKAAQTLSLVIDDYDIENEVARLVIPEFKSQNALHGRLLCLRFLLTRVETPLTGRRLCMLTLITISSVASLSHVLVTYERLFSDFEDQFESSVSLNPCPMTAAAFLDSLAELCKLLTLSRGRLRILLSELDLGLMWILILR